MTERDLFAYRRAVNAYERATDELMEFNPRFYSANISSITGLPKGTPPFSPDRLSGKINEHDEYTRAWYKAYKKMQDERAKLAAISQRLTAETHKQYLHYRYVKGHTNAELCRKLHRSKTALFRDRLAILEVVAAM